QVDPGDPRAPGLRALLEVLDSKARDHGVTRSVVALAWLLKHPAGIIPIVGSVKPDRIRNAATADEFEMSREDWYTIQRAARMRPLP
ncbi:MAG TPA: aldo/keto reductase, partial [Candidatus Eisenbacteria bacterium]|nr:aldo/keto reductase [Candidatus Eisenbacteria bacterium]